MTTRERFHAVMNFQPFDRLPLLEWATWWDKTIERWHTEGLPDNVTDRYDICRYFGQDVYKQGWFRATHWDAPKPAHHGAGIIEDEAGYERIHHYLYQVLDEWPVNPAEWQRWKEEQERGDVVLWFTVDGFFWYARALLGIERHLYAFYDQPDLVHRINDELSDWMLKIIDRLCEICVPDFMTFAEDMSYNHGPMLSEQLFNEFMLPYYTKVVPKLKDKGIFAIIDSDGDITAAAPWFDKAGLDGILPLERQAGVDLADIRTRHPRMRFIGHYDKMVMNKGEAAMRAEFERVLPVAQQGGFIPSCDHQTPPGVSYEDYTLYMKLFEEYACAAGGNEQK
jgi:hypothetical protein